MRWRFVDPNNRKEVAQRNKITAKIDSWWREFQRKKSDISALFSQQKEWDLPEWMDQHLQSIDPRLMWEYGPAVQCDGHRLVITPESARHLRPLVRAILERAPTIDGWEFYEHRLAEDLESTQATVEGRSGCDISEFKVQVSRGEHNRIDLKFAASEIDDGEDSPAFNAAFVAAETLLGERILDHWVGTIEIASLPRGKAGGKFIPLSRLQETTAALIDSISEQLPAKPHCEWIEDATWTMWELKPEQGDDYLNQHDLFVGSSVNPEQWMAAHSGFLFSSERFSRCGETFCYVKLDGSQGLDEEHFADKSEIEDALDAVLRPKKLGCHMGGGTGLRYSYLDLALTDVDKAIEAIRQRLQAGKIHKRSWILFHDSDLAAEWVGVYDDSPPPPMENE